MTTMQKVLIAAALAAAVGTGFYEAHEASTWRARARALQQRMPATEQVNQLTQELHQSASQLAAHRSENERLNGNTADLMRLRAEVTRLRAEAGPTGGNANEAAAKAWLDRVDLLKQRLEQRPDHRIPELEWATEDDWLNAARRELATDTDYRRALSGLRSAVELRFSSKLKSALDKYLATNGHQFPPEMSALHPYFEPPVNEAALQRYAVLPAAELRAHRAPNEKFIISQKAPVDETYDSRVIISELGARQSGGAWPTREDEERAEANKVLLPALKAYLEANGGRQFTNPEALLPFCTTDEQKAQVQKVISWVNAVKASGRK